MDIAIDSIVNKLDSLRTEVSQLKDLKSRTDIDIDTDTDIDIDIDVDIYTLHMCTHPSTHTATTTSATWASTPWRCWRGRT